MAICNSKITTLLLVFISVLSTFNFTSLLEQEYEENNGFISEEKEYNFLNKNKNTYLTNEKFLSRQLTAVTPTFEQTYTYQGYFLSDFKSVDITVHDIKIINGMTALLSDNYLIHSSIIDNQLVLYAEYIDDTGVTYLTEYSYSSSSDAFTLDPVNSSLYTASANANYLGDNEFLLFYTYSFDTNRYTIYSRFIKFNTSTEAFEASSYDAYNDYPLVFPANERTDISDFTTDTNYYYTNVIQTLYINNSSGVSYTIILSISIYDDPLDLSITKISYNFCKLPHNTAVLSSLISGSSLCQTQAAYTISLLNSSIDSNLIDSLYSVKMINNNIDDTVMLTILSYLENDKIIIIKWDPSSTDMSLTINSSITIADTTRIYSVQFAYYNYQSRNHLYVMMYRYITSSSQYNISYYRYIITASSITPDTAYPLEFQTLPDSTTIISFLRIIGNWVIYCTESPNACYTWLHSKPDYIDDNSANNYGHHLMKFNTDYSADNSDIPWSILDMSFFEKSNDSEIIPLFFFVELKPGSNKYHAAKSFLTSNGDCLFLKKYKSYLPGNTICCLKCYIYQYFYYGDTNCYTCGTYILKDNDCVVDNGTNGTVLRYDIDSRFFDVRDFSFLANYEVNFRIDNTSSNNKMCNDDEIRLNNQECKTCPSDYYLIKQGYDCQKYCFKGQTFDETTNICSSNDCETGLVLQLGYCVEHCNVNGLVLDTTTNECIKCEGSYELNNSSCVSSDQCNVDFTNYTPATNNSVFYAWYCHGCDEQLYQDGSCVDSCTINGYAIDPSYNYCTECANGEYALELETCVATCPEGYVNDTNPGNNNAKYCKKCDFVYEDGVCKSSCENLGYVDNDGICGPCANDMYYNTLTSTCENCNEITYIIHEILPITNAKICKECSSGEYVENNTCVSSCLVEFHFPDSNDECKYCYEASKPYLNREGNECVGECQTGEVVQTKANFSQCIFIPICNAGTYLLIDRCLDSCPSNYYEDTVNNKCVESCSLDLFISNNQCVSSCSGTLYLQYKGTCVEACPGGYFIDHENKCVVKCSGDFLYYYNNSCVTACPSDYFSYNYFCLTSCPENYLHYDGNCVLNCPAEAPLTQDSYCMSSCFSEYYIFKSTCVSSCPESNKYIYNKSCLTSCPENYSPGNSNKCALKTDNSNNGNNGNNGNATNNDYGIIVNLNSTILCPANQTTVLKNDECLDCYLTDFPYILDSKCVNTCGTIYETVQSGNDKVCIYKKVNNEICPDYCNNQGDCSLSVDGEGECSCYENYYGSRCNLTSADLLTYNTRLSDDSSEVDSVSNISYSTLDSILSYISDMTSIIEIAPELYLDSILQQLVEITNNLISECLESDCIPNSQLYQLIDFTLLIKSIGNSTISTDNVVNGLNEINSQLFQDDTITQYMSHTNSSIIYKGKTFSVQVSDNSVKDITEARENDLPIVDYSECIDSLISSGVISNETKLYSINANVNYGVYDDRSSHVLTSSAVINSNLVDDNKDLIDTSSCSSLIFKTSVNSEAVKYDDYKQVMSQVGVDIYNKSSTFFSDMCFKYLSYNSTDITVVSRREKYNLTAECSTNCTYIGIDEHGYSQCDCDGSASNRTSNAMKSVSQYFEESIFDNLLDNNIMLIYCFHEAFDSSTIKENIGFWVLTLGTIVVILVFSGIEYCFKDYIINKHLDKLLFNDCQYGIKEIDKPNLVGNAGNAGNLGNVEDKRKIYRNRNQSEGRLLKNNRDNYQYTNPSNQHSTINTVNSIYTMNTMNTLNTIENNSPSNNKFFDSHSKNNKNQIYDNDHLVMTSKSSNNSINNYNPTIVSVFEDQGKNKQFTNPNNCIVYNKRLLNTNVNSKTSTQNKTNTNTSNILNINNYGDINTKYYDKTNSIRIKKNNKSNNRRQSSNFNPIIEEKIERACYKSNTNDLSRYITNKEQKEYTSIMNTEDILNSCKNKNTNTNSNININKTSNLSIIPTNLTIKTIRELCCINNNEIKFSKSKSCEDNIKLNMNNVSYYNNNNTNISSCKYKYNNKIDNVDYTDHSVHSSNINNNDNFRANVNINVNTNNYYLNINNNNNIFLYNTIEIDSDEPNHEISFGEKRIIRDIVNNNNNKHDNKPGNMNNVIPFKVGKTEAKRRNQNIDIPFSVNSDDDSIDIHSNDNNEINSQNRNDNNNNHNVNNLNNNFLSNTSNNNPNKPNLTSLKINEVYNNIPEIRISNYEESDNNNNNINHNNNQELINRQSNNMFLRSSKYNKNNNINADHTELNSIAINTNNNDNNNTNNEENKKVSEKLITFFADSQHLINKRMLSNNFIDDTKRTNSLVKPVTYNLNNPNKSNNNTNNLSKNKEAYNFNNFANINNNNQSTNNNLHSISNTLNSNNKLFQLADAKFELNRKHTDKSNKNNKSDKKKPKKFSLIHEELSKNELYDLLKDAKYKDIRSQRDFSKLPMQIQLRIDDRSILRFFWESLIVDHEVLNIFFIKSNINPVWLRLITVCFQYSMDFALNAVFFTSSIINNQVVVKAEEGAEAIGFWYIINNEFWKCFWPVIISLLIMQLVYIIIIIPDRFLMELNSYLLTKDKNEVQKG